MSPPSESFPQHLVSDLHSESSAFLQRAYTSSSPADARAVYDEWASSYDAHLAEEEYAFPELAAGALVDALGTTNATTAGQDSGIRGGELRILDAGCGTGLAGIALSTTQQEQQHQHGAPASASASASKFRIDGLDISPGMLALARRSGVYASLDEADLTKPLARVADGQYEAVLCVGTLTKGHVGPEPVLGEFARVTKVGGLIVATVLDEVWESGGFRARVDELVGLGEVEVVQAALVGVRRDAVDGGRLLVLRRL